MNALAYAEEEGAVFAAAFEGCRANKEGFGVALSSSPSAVDAGTAATAEEGAATAAAAAAEGRGGVCGTAVGHCAPPIVGVAKKRPMGDEAEETPENMSCDAEAESTVAAPPPPTTAAPAEE